MISSLPIDQAIRTRISVRRYDPTPLPAGAIDALLEAGRTALPLRPELPVRFERLPDGSAAAAVLGAGMGVYGRIMGAPHYLAAIAGVDPHSLTEVGYRMEQMVLRARSLGLGTCWMGGFYSKAQAARSLALRPDQAVVAITPLGRPATDAPGLAARAIKALTPGRGQRQALSELVFLEHWGAPVAGALEGRPALAALLEAAQVAPSWVNSQPWRFVISGSDIVVTASQPRGQRGIPYYVLDAGICMSHLALMAGHLSLAYEWELGAERLAALRGELGVPAAHDVLGLLHVPGCQVRIG
jgi:nitroreductase